MNKIAAADVDFLMTKAANSIRELAAENRSLRAALAEHDRKSHAQKIASLAVNNGIMDDDAAADYAAELVDSDQDLSLVEQFVSRQSQGLPLGHTVEKTASDFGGATAGSAEDRFLTDLLSSDLA